MPFGRMVVLMVTWAIASIPALVILTAAGAFVLAVITSTTGWL
jgi:hypothetical protein